MNYPAQTFVWMHLHQCQYLYDISSTHLLEAGAVSYINIELRKLQGSFGKENHITVGQRKNITTVTVRIGS